MLSHPAQAFFFSLVSSFQYPKMVKKKNKTQKLWKACVGEKKEKASQICEDLTYGLTQLPAMCLDQLSRGMPKQRALSNSIKKSPRLKIAVHAMHRTFLFLKIMSRLSSRFAVCILFFCVRSSSLLCRRVTCWLLSFSTSLIFLFFLTSWKSVRANLLIISTPLTQIHLA